MRPDLEGDWNADEMVHYFKRNHNWIWNLMHHEQFKLMGFRTILKP
jgi:hypothetical protein